MIRAVRDDIKIPAVFSLVQYPNDSFVNNLAFPSRTKLKAESGISSVRNYYIYISASCRRSLYECRNSIWRRIHLDEEAPRISASQRPHSDGWYSGSINGKTYVRNPPNISTSLRARDGQKNKRPLEEAHAKSRQRQEGRRRVRYQIPTVVDSTEINLTAPLTHSAFPI